MFSNRGFGWKLLAALAIVAGMGLLSDRRGNSIQPSLWRCVAQPARWDGTALWLSGLTVTASDAEGFDVRKNDVRARVVPAAPVAPGDAVALTGTFHAAGPLIRSKEVRKVAPTGRWRRVSEIVSIAMLALIGLNFLRHFAFRPKAAHVEGVD